MSEDDRFLSRWSQRKRLAAEEARKAAEPAPAPTTEPAPPEEPFDLSLLPDIEALTPQTDISLFLKKGVPDTLRNAALRKMWALDPEIRDYVGDALDYAWDWNAPGGVPGGGELGEGFDTAKMVAQIFGDDTSDKNVIDHAAVQQEAPDVTSAGTEPLEIDLPENLAFAKKEAAAQASDKLEPNPAKLAPDAAPHKKRRHGGAAPSPSAKSIVS